MECKLEGCDQEVPPSKGRPRLFCTAGHRVLYWDAATRPASQPKHSMSEIDEETLTGTCAICGPGVRAYRTEDKYEDGRPRLRWVCAKRVAAGRGDASRRYGKSDKGRRVAMRSRYQLTSEDLEAALAKRKDHCEICGAKPKRLVLDHCHSGGHVRGWLCDGCNLMLGNAQDNPERLRRAAEYLERSTANH